MARSAPVTVPLEGPLLTRQRVDALAARLDARGGADAIVVDCRAVTAIDPGGLCALLDLAQTRDAARCVFAGLAPALMRGALEVGLARWLAICSDADAARALLQGEQAEACGP